MLDNPLSDALFPFHFSFTETPSPFGESFPLSVNSGWRAHGRVGRFRSWFLRIGIGSVLFWPRLGARMGSGGCVSGRGGKTL